MNPWSELKSLLGLICAYRCEKPVLVHHFTTKAIAYGSLAANLTGVPAVVNQVTVVVKQRRDHEIVGRPL